MTDIEKIREERIWQMFMRLINHTPDDAYDRAKRLVDKYEELKQNES